MARKQTVKPDHLRVRVLGASEFQIGSRRIGMNTEALFALGLYLSTRAGERIPRDEVLDVFWTEGEEESRRHAMRQMMYRLRQKGLVLDEEGEFLRLDAGRVDSDIVDCLKSDWVERATPAEVEAALALGPTFSTRLAAPFLEWFDGVRAAVASQHRKAAQKQITLARREGRWADLDRWAQSVLKSDPLNEEATLARAESAAMDGSKVAALEILDAYLAEIGEVAPELGKPAMVLRKRIAEKRADWSRRAATEVTLVGRQQLMTRLATAIDSAGRSAGTTVVLAGAPGIGKSRIAREALTFAGLQGVRCVSVRAEASLSARPLALAAMVIEELMSLPGALGISPQALQLLQDVVRRSPERTPNLGAAVDLESISDALGDLVGAVSEQCRFAAFIDDGHHVDDASRIVLEEVMNATRSRRVVWVVTTRTTSSPWYPSSNRLIVGPLDASASRELAVRVCDALNRRLPEERVDLIARIAGGNPLFLREIASHHQRPGDLALPESLVEIIESRLSSLDEAATRLLRIVALLGRSATLERTTALATLSGSDFSRLLEALESEGIISLEIGGSLSLHECWQTAVLDAMSPLTAATLALECANAITASHPRSLTLDDSWRAGSLYQRAGARDRALHCLLHSADQLLTAGVHSQAAAVLTQAEACTPQGPVPYALTSRLCELALAQGNPLEVERLTRHLPTNPRSLVGTGEDVSEWALALSHRIDAVSKLSTYENLDINILLDASRCTEASAMSRQYVAFIGSRLAVWYDDIDALNAFHAASREAADADGHTFASGFVDIIHACEVGSEDEMLAAETLLATFEQSQLPLRLRLQAARYRAVAHRMFGRIEEARTKMIAVLDRSLAVDQLEVAGACAESLAFLHLDQNDPVGARSWITAGREYDERATNRLRRKALQHAHVRCLLQLGRSADAISAMKADWESVVSDPVPRRRAGELLTFAYAHLVEGRPVHEVASLIEEQEVIVSRARPGFLFDYNAELLIRCLEALDSDRARRLQDSYVTRRMVEFCRPLPPFFSRLRESGAFPDGRL